MKHSRSCVKDPPSRNGRAGYWGSQENKVIHRIFIKFATELLFSFLKLNNVKLFIVQGVIIAEQSFSKNEGNDEESKLDGGLTSLLQNNTPSPQQRSTELSTPH